ncbi:MAG: hypothetical protein ABF291_07930, partial [Desulfobacterales bacterium]
MLDKENIECPFEYKRLSQKKVEKMKKIDKAFKSGGDRLRARSIILAVWFLFTITGLCTAQAEETGTTEEILKILKERGIVTDQQY